MAIWLQHLLVIALSLASLSAVVWQSIATLRGGRSKIGSCCAKGCSAANPPKKPEERVVFLPVEMLGRRRRK